MKLTQVKSRLENLAAELKDIGVERLSVFGSVGRGDEAPASDLDFLVEFEGSSTFQAFMTLKELLEHEFGCKVDLVTHKALKPQLRDHILQEAVRVA